MTPTPSKHPSIRMALALFRACGLPGALLLGCLAITSLGAAGLIWLTASAARGMPIPQVVAIAAALLLIADLFEDYKTLLLTHVRDRIDLHVRHQFIHAVSTWPDLALFEHRDHINDRLAASQAVDKMSYTVVVTTNLVQALFTAGPMVALALTVHPALPILIIAGSVPVAYYSIRLEGKVWTTQQSHNALFDRSNSLEKSATQPEYAKDVRQFQMANWLSREWRRSRTTVLSSLLAVRTRGSITITLLGIVSVAGSVAGMLIAALSAPITLPAIIIMLGVLIQLRQQSYALVATCQSLGELIPPLRSLASFLDARSHQTMRLERRPPTTGASITATDITYHYPNSTKPILDHITFSSGSSRNIAIVGPNGAGKSTLVRLLAGLATPTGGMLRLPYDTAVSVHQDYARFPLTLRENLTCGRPLPDHRLLTMLSTVALTEWYTDLPDGLDTLLYRSSQNGVVPSGGQWQKIAIARALLLAPVGSLILLDEPTANLDAFAEGEMLDILRSHLSESTVVLVTHRMDHAAQSDYMLVLRAGGISFAGSPAAALTQDPWFRHAHRVQGRGYRRPPTTTSPQSPEAD